MGGWDAAVKLAITLAAIIGILVFGVVLLADSRSGSQGMCGGWRQGCSLYNENGVANGIWTPRYPGSAGYPIGNTWYRDAMPDCVKDRADCESNSVPGDVMCGTMYRSCKYVY